MKQSYHSPIGAFQNLLTAFYGLARVFPPGQTLSSPIRSGRLQRADVIDDRLRPAIDVRPLAVADVVLVGGHVDPSR